MKHIISLNEIQWYLYPSGFICGWTNEQAAASSWQPGSEAKHYFSCKSPPDDIAKLELFLEICAIAACKGLLKARPLTYDVIESFPE